MPVFLSHDEFYEVCYEVSHSRREPVLAVAELQSRYGPETETAPGNFSERIGTMPVITGVVPVP
jgi:hypothetical protein